jgi:Holliday junction resolvase
MTEAEITKRAVKAIRDRGHFAVKIHGGPSQPAGLPDIVACICGHFVGIEMKKPEKRGNLTARQQKKLRDIKLARGIGVVCTSVTEVESVCERIEVKYAG